MEEILHQLIGSLVYPMIYKVLYIPGGAGFQPSTVLPKTLAGHPFRETAVESFRLEK